MMRKAILILLLIFMHTLSIAAEEKIIDTEIPAPAVNENMVDVFEEQPVSATEEEVIVNPMVLVSGKLLEKGTKRLLANQRFYIRNYVGTKVVLSPLTDDKGRFSFQIEPGKYRFIVASSGYDKFEEIVYIKETKNQPLVLRVIPQVINPYKIVVRKKKEKSEISEKTITIQEAANIPGNNRDVLQAVTSMPGVNSVSVFNGYGNGIVIRGSAQEDSIFPLEGHGITSLYHFGGLESILEPEFIESVDYNAGGFSAEYGNTLGGVVSMNVRDPRVDRIGGYVNLSLLSSSFMVEGPISEKDSFAFSMKRGFLDQYMRMVEKVEEEKNRNDNDDGEEDSGFEQYPVYYDGSFIYRHEFSDKSDFRLIGIFSDDAFEFKDAEASVSERFSNRVKYSVSAQNLIGEWNYKTEKLNYQFSPKISSSEFLWKEGARAYHKQTVQDVSINEKLEYRFNKIHRLKSGLRFDFTDIKIDSHAFVIDKEGEVDNDNYKLEMKLKKNFHLFYPSFYLMDQITIGDFTITPGVNGFIDSHNNQNVLDPRLFLKYQLTKKAAFKVATGLYSKRPLLDETAKPWGTKGLKPERSIHAVAGAEYYFTNDFYIDIQGYYKKFYDMAVRIDDDDPTKYGNEGEGKAYGSEILLRHNMTDNFFGWISYSWAVAKRKDGKSKPERFFDSDITNNLIGVLNYKPNRYWSFGFKYQYSTGTPYTDLFNVSTFYDVDNDEYSPVYSGKINGSRLKSHQQLDFRIDKYWLFDNYVLSTYIDIKNVFQAKHEVGIEYNEDYTAQIQELAVGSETPLIFVGLKIDF